MRKHPGRQGPRRAQVVVRLADAGIAAIDTRAVVAGVNRSEMFRRMLAYAEEHMPEDTA